MPENGTAQVTPKNASDVYVLYSAKIMELQEEEKKLKGDLQKLEEGLKRTEDQKKKADSEFSKIKLELQKANKELDEAKVKGLSEIEDAHKGLDEKINQVRTAEKLVEEDHKKVKDEDDNAKRLQARLEAKIKETEAAKSAYQAKRESFILQQSGLEEQQRNLEKREKDLGIQEAGLESREGTMSQAKVMYKEMEEKSKLAAKEAAAEVKKVVEEHRKNEQLLSVIRKERGEHMKFYALAKELQIFIIQHSFDEDAIRKAIEDAFPTLKGSVDPPSE